MLLQTPFFVHAVSFIQPSEQMELLAAATFNHERCRDITTTEVNGRRHVTSKGC
jgi:hypothetical protein